MAFDRPGKRLDWIRDELIVALDFYLRHAGHEPSKTSREIAELSAKIRSLEAYPLAEQYSEYRNGNGVYFKLMNFRRLDPLNAGSGATHGGNLEIEVWNNFASDPEKCRKTAEAILAGHASPAVPAELSSTDGFVEAAEGKELTRQHVYRERNRKLVETRKKTALAEHGWLECEVCSFIFRDHYKGMGDKFIECHHTTPLHEYDPGQKTRLKDLALLCANCHRMIHSQRPWLTVDELKALYIP